MENKRCQVSVWIYFFDWIAPTEKDHDYYKPVHFPIMQYKTVEELLKHWEEATKTVGQEYVINTFDLGVCMKALPLEWKYPDQYLK